MLIGIPEIEIAPQQNMFRSFDILTARISLYFDSIITQSQINSKEPAFMAVLSMIYS
jgi:hypothetical protein